MKEPQISTAITVLLGGDESYPVKIGPSPDNPQWTSIEMSVLSEYSAKWSEILTFPTAELPILIKALEMYRNCTSET